MPPIWLSIMEKICEKQCKLKQEKSYRNQNQSGVVLVGFLLSTILRSCEAG